MKLAMVYDMDACRGPTGVTRHALAQLERLARNPRVELTIVSGRIHEPDGLAFWEKWENLRRRELPVSTRHALRFWRLAGWPPLELWTGRQDWVYCPSEYLIPTRGSRKAVTSHDVLQDLRFGTARRRELLGQVVGSADLVLSVSQFNTDQLLEAFPDGRGKVAIVPNAAEDLFFEPSTESQVAAVRAGMGLPPGVPYLLSVANFQPRKNLPRMIDALRALREVAEGELAIVLVGEGSEAETEAVRRAAQGLGPKARVVLPGYRQGDELRALYAGAAALVFPSVCESFGIPAVEAMAQGCPVALADSTALPEVAGDAGWYFRPDEADSIAGAVRSLLGDRAERDRRATIGRERASLYRWDTAHDALMRALDGERVDPSTQVKGSSAGHR